MGKIFFPLSSIDCDLCWGAIMTKFVIAYRHYVKTSVQDVAQTAEGVRKVQEEIYLRS